MADLPTSGTEYTIVCPHCSKRFQATLMGGSAARYSGFKCPHCRLFVPYERIAEQAAAEPA